MSELLDGLLERLERERGDTTDIEVKAAAGGLPQTVTSSLCALANRPGGGWLILGLAENASARSGERVFSPVELADVGKLRKGLAGKARSCFPPVQLETTQDEVDGHPVLMTRVMECDPAVKPCRVGARGPAYVRLEDGDYQMSPLEEQAFLSTRTQPRFDQAPVEGAAASDLDPGLVRLWSATVAELDRQGLGRFSGDEQLFRAGILTSDGVPTKAGLLALGVQPQQFFPRYVVNLAVEEPPARAAATGEVVRASELTTLSGPIPLMLEACMDWARKVFTRTSIVRPDGAVREKRQYPLEAFRELICNALVHRDLDAWSQGQAIEVRLSAGTLRVTSPGGLYGITVDRLGQQGRTSARNGYLIEICKYTRSDDGARVVETLASGIPRILTTVAAAGLPAPAFHDTGLNFTAILRTPLTAQASEYVAMTDSVEAVLETVDDRVAKLAAGGTHRAVWDALAGGPRTVKQLAAATGRTPANLRKSLRRLRDMSLVVQDGGKGRTTTYHRIGE